MVCRWDSAPRGRPELKLHVTLSIENVTAAHHTATLILVEEDQTYVDTASPFVRLVRLSFAGYMFCKAVEL